MIAHDPYADATGGIALVALTDLLERSDTISIHTPLTPETRGLFGRAEFERMRHAILVNTSSGPIVRRADLLDALRHGVIGGADQLAAAGGEHAGDVAAGADDGRDPLVVDRRRGSPGWTASPPRRRS